MHRIQYYGMTRTVPGDLDLSDAQLVGYHMAVQACGDVELSEIEKATLRAVCMDSRVVPYDVALLLEHVRRAERNKWKKAGAGRQDEYCPCPAGELPDGGTHSPGGQVW